MSCESNLTRLTKIAQNVINDVSFPSPYNPRYELQVRTSVSKESAFIELNCPPGFFEEDVDRKTPKDMGFDIIVDKEHNTVIFDFLSAEAALTFSEMIQQSVQQLFSVDAKKDSYGELRFSFEKADDENDEN